LYAARPKWMALDPSMRVLSRSKKAAARSIYLRLGIDPARDLPRT
jgi:hypothetical protein